MLQDEYAIDVSRITGIPWFWARLVQRGPLQPAIDCRALREIYRLRVAFTLVGGHYYVDTVGETSGRGRDSNHVADRVVGGDAAIG